GSIRLLVLRAEDALLAGRSPAEPAREAAEWWEADPAPFFRLVEHMAWEGSPDLMPVLATAVHDDDDEDWDDDDDDDGDGDGGDGGDGDFDDDDDDDWDEEDALDGEDLDDLVEESAGDDDDEEYEYCGCGEHGEIDDWHARLLPMFSGLLALDAVKRGRLDEVRAGLVQAGVGETATAVTEGLVRMAGLAPEDVRAGALRKAEGEDLARALVDLMYDFARYLRDAHAWPAPRAMLAAQRITELVLFRGDEVAGRGADRPWCFDPSDAAEAVRAAAADGFPHSSAALAAGLPLWEDFLGATKLVKPADARARAAAVRAALGS
ncbi:MAG: hypothetical protein FJ087_15805, partial [Deltaproteobacteria bacterium]|nr:hypothetical protein [Deltaproteobacteria bacterium]